MKNKIIQIRNIEKSFTVMNRKQSVLCDMDFDIFEGEFLMIVGPSGSGKSTLLHTICGWLEPEHGDIMVNKKNIYLHNQNDREKLCQKYISCVEQSPTWIKSLNTIQNMAIPLIAKGENKNESLKKANKLIEILKLQEYKNHNPLDLSGGQQQRISILRALVDNPKVLITDEPTGNLDAESSEEVINFLYSLNKNSGLTIIMATHDQSILGYADRIIHIKNGKVDKIIKNKSTKLKTNDEFNVSEIKKVME